MQECVNKLIELNYKNINELKDDIENDKFIKNELTKFINSEVKHRKCNYEYNDNCQVWFKLTGAKIKYEFDDANIDDTITFANIFILDEDQEPLDSFSYPVFPFTIRCKIEAKAIQNLCDEYGRDNIAIYSLIEKPTKLN